MFKAALLHRYGLADPLYVLFFGSHRKVIEPTEDEMKTSLGLDDSLSKGLKASVTAAWATVLVDNAWRMRSLSFPTVG
jgi:hypothetical protein